MLKDGRAETATVERAYAVLGLGWMQSHYDKSGHGWTGTLADNGAVTWEPFGPPSLRAVS